MADDGLQCRGRQFWRRLSLFRWTIATQSLTFNSTSGALTSGNPATLQLPGGATVNLDVSGSTQLSSAFAVNTATVNGNAPSAISGVQVGTNGALSYSLANGQSVLLIGLGWPMWPAQPI